MDALTRRLISEHEQLKPERSRVDSVWRELCRLVLPSHDGFGRDAPPDAPDPLIYDDAGEEANRLHAAVLNYLLTPDGQRWHGLEPADTDLEDDAAVAMWCELATKQLFKLRQKSAFASQIHECWLSIGAVGPGCMYLDDVPGFGLRYEACAMAGVWFNEGTDGSKDRVHRAYELPARLVGQQFEKVPEKLAKVIEREPDRPVKLLHVVEPNLDREEGRAGPAGMRFASHHVALEFAETLRSGGYRTMPYAIGRYLVAPGEVYGRSPGWAVLPTLQTLNTIARNDLIESNRRAQPPLLAIDDDLQEPPILAPNAINYGWLDSSGNPRVRPMDFGGERGRLESRVEEMRGRVDRAFLVSLFLMLTRNPDMTATEVMERASEKGIVLAPIMGRLQGELLRPMIKRELDVASARGLLPPPPPVLIERGGIKVSYTAPLARLVAADESRGIMETANAAGVLAELDPAVLHRLDLEAGIEKIARANRVPAAVIRTDREVAQRKAAAAQAQQAQEAMAAAPVAADVAQKLGSLPR